ncbi:MAG: HAD family hydrolase [Spirochaetales bacterium]|nr:HAD family hydrolase [Spirochaetales bacterium]
MKIYKLSNSNSNIIFDIDSTLYTNSKYKDYQNDYLILKLAHFLDRDLRSVKDEVEREIRYQKSIGGKSSLGNIFKKFGVSIKQNCLWRDEFRVEEFLVYDKELVEIIRALASRFKIAALTNNTKKIADKSLSLLGVADFFSAVTTLETIYESKPSKRFFDAALASISASYSDTLFVGDRFDVDLQTPLANSADAILVNGVEDVYKLKDLLLDN